MHNAAVARQLPFAEPETGESPSLLDEILAATERAAAPAPRPAPVQVKVTSPKVASPSKPSRSLRVDDFVFYTSKAGKRKRYRVAGQGRNGVVWLQMLGHFGGDPLKGKRFPVRQKDLELDTYTDNGSRYCAVCGERSCNIGPFATR